MSDPIKNIRDMAAGYAARNMAQPSLLRDLVAAADAIEGVRNENAALRWAYHDLADDCDIEPVCDEYDPGGEGTIMRDGSPQCAACGHSLVVHSDEDRRAFLAARKAVGG